MCSYCETAMDQQAPAVREEDDRVAVPEDVKAILLEMASKSMERGYCSATSSELGIDGTSDKEEMNPQERFMDLITLLRTQLDKIISYVKQANLPNDEANRADLIRQDFESFQHTLDLIDYYVDVRLYHLSESMVEGYEKKVLQYRCTQIRDFKTDMNTHIKTLFDHYHAFWSTTQVTNFDLWVLHIEALNKDVCKMIDELIGFAKYPIHGEIFRRTQEVASSIGNLMSENIIEPDFAVKAVIKLCRLFLDKISKQTSSAHVILRQMTPDDLLAFDRALDSAFSSVSELLLDVHPQAGTPMDLKPDVVKETLGCFRKLKKCIDKFLASPLPEADQASIKTLVDWLQLWDTQFCKALKRVIRLLCGEIKPELYPSIRALYEDPTGPIDTPSDGSADLNRRREDPPSDRSTDLIVQREDEPSAAD